MRKIILALTLAVMSTAAMAQTVPVEGEVKKINEAQGKITRVNGKLTVVKLEPRT